MRRREYAFSNAKTLKNDIFFVEGAKKGEDTDVWYRVALINDVVISKEETTIYKRMYSSATKDGFHVFDWVFANRIDNILNDKSIVPERKQAAVALVDRFKMTSSREAMLNNDKNKAKSIIETISNKQSKHYKISKIICLLPPALFKFIYRVFLIIRRL